MPNPWDSFPFPLMGDKDPKDTYAGVGRVASEWEAIEFNLARVYSVFIGKPDDASALHAYGKSKIYRERRIGLQQVASAYFVRKPDQKLEGEFDAICEATDGFADRRNEVVHGLVLNVAPRLFYKSKLRLAEPGTSQHLVVPPYHSVRNHSRYVGLPEWAYSAGQMQTLSERLLACSLRIVAFRKSL